MASLLPIQFPINGLGKSAEDGPSTKVPASYVGNLDEASGYSGHCGSEPVYRRSLSVSLFFCVCVCMYVSATLTFE